MRGTCGAAIAGLAVNDCFEAAQAHGPIYVVIGSSQSEIPRSVLSLEIGILKSAQSAGRGCCKWLSKVTSWSASALVNIIAIKVCYKHTGDGIRTLLLERGQRQGR